MSIFTGSPIIDNATNHLAGAGKKAKISLILLILVRPFRRIKRSGFLFFVVAFLSGCAGNHIMTEDGACLTCFNNPFTGEGVNHEGDYESEAEKVAAANEKVATTNEKGSVAAADGCVRSSGDSIFKCDPRMKMERTIGSFEMEVPVDVDLAYARIKRSFDYKTPEEIRVEHGDAGNWIIGSGDYRYHASPGTAYTMKRDFADYTHNGTPVYTHVEVYMERLTENSSVLSFSYRYADPSLPKASYETDWKNKALSALGL